MKSFSTKLALGLIIVMAATLRFWHISSNPPGLFADEASNGYNAYSILKTGRDEYGNFMPLVFKSFGDYNPAFSVYTLLPSIKVFGLNIFAVRFPSALLGTLTIPLVFLFTKKLLDNNSKIGLISAFFLAISPWHIQFSRYDHEANFMLTFIIAALTTFLYTKKSIGKLTLSAFFFAIAFNSYQGAKILVPIVVLLLLAIYRKEILSFGKKLIFPLLILFLSTQPILLNFKNSLIRGQSVGILKDQNPVNTFVRNYLSHFSPNFLFTQGDTIGRHSVSGMGELYVFQIPLLLIGIWACFKLKGKNKYLLLGLLALAAIPASLTTPAPHALRSILFAPIWSIIIAMGLLEILNANFSKVKTTIFLLLLSLIGLYNFATYLHLYYSHYPKLRARDWQDGYFQMVQFVDPQKDNYTQIAVSNYFGQPYIFVLFFSKYDPRTYQTKGLEKYEFFGSSWQKSKPGKALVVTPPWQAHPSSVLKEVYAANGDLTFTISETE